MYQNGTTPLMFAAMYGYLPVVEYLVERGTDAQAKDNVSYMSSFGVKPHIRYT